jgi:hypothetical protein
MGSFLDLLADWFDIDRKAEDTAKAHSGAPKPPKPSGKTEGTALSKVSLFQVVPLDVPLKIVEKGDINVRHRKISGSWGLTDVKAVLHYALPVGKDGLLYPTLMGVKVGADITLKPKSEFKTIKEFEPHYQRFRLKFKGDRVAFCRSMATRVFKDYNDFGTVDGVLYHELVHLDIAKKLAEQLYKKTLQALPSSGLKTAHAARAVLRKATEKSWDKWRGLDLHSGNFLDERFVWEKECAFYLRRYEEALR